MHTRQQLDHDLDELAGMLPIWLEKLRHPTEFWPQFEALAQAIADQASPEEHMHVQERLQLMLQQNNLHRPSTPCFPDAA